MFSSMSRCRVQPLTLSIKPLKFLSHYIILTCGWRSAILTHADEGTAVSCDHFYSVNYGIHIVLLCETMKISPRDRTYKQKYTY